MLKKSIITGVSTLFFLGISLNGNAVSFDSTIQKPITGNHLKNEIGLNIVSFINSDYYHMTNDIWLSNSHYFGTLKPTAQMNIGLIYKSDKGKYVQRMIITVVNERFEYLKSGNPRGYYYESEGQSAGFELRYGYEKQFSKKKLQPYGSIDLIAGYRVQKIEGFQSSKYGGRGFFNNEYRMKEFGIAPGLGVKYKFSDRFSISLETNFRISYFHFKEKDSENDIKIYGMFKKPIRMFVDPLRFMTLNYHF